MIEPGRFRFFELRRNWLLVALVCLAPAAPASADCLAPNNTAISINLPDYPFWRQVARQMEQCGNVDSKFGFDAISVFPSATSPDRNLGSLVGVSNTSFSRLISQRLLRPIDDLVEKYRDQLHDRQLIRSNGKIHAIAVTGNMRALMVHSDLFRQEAVAVPDTYDQLLQAAEALQGNSLYERSLALPLKRGWNLTEAFVEHYLAQGGQLFDGANRPLIAGETGQAVLARLKALSAFLQEDYLETSDVGQTLDDLLKFRAPVAINWISSAGPLENPAVSRVAGKIQYLRPPSVSPDGPPAATLWWDGFAIPVSATNEEAEAAFRTALEGLDKDMLDQNRDIAFWLLKDYEPGVLTKDLLAAIDAGLPAYPASEPLELLQRTLASHLEAFMKGEASANEALAAAEADYLQAARERGMEGL